MNKEEILQKKNVIGVGKGRKHVKGVDTGRDAIVVFVTKKAKTKNQKEALGEDFIPSTIDGIETDIIETDEFKAFRTTKHRPMLGGVSGGHYKITAGTLSGLYINDKILIITNNHVGANCNDALIGDPIWQPGRVDGGCSDDIIGYLEGFVPIKFSGNSVCSVANGIVNFCNWVAKVTNHNTRIPKPVSEGTNKVDLAWASVAPGCRVLTEIIGIGEIFGYRTLNVDDKVRKSGRTTEVTEGKVTAVDARVRVNFGSKGYATFDEQILTTEISEPGDSGSLVVDVDNNLGGILFAGSSTLTIVNTVDNVLAALKK